MQKHRFKGTQMNGFILRSLRSKQVQEMIILKKITALAENENDNVDKYVSFILFSFL